MTAVQSWMHARAVMIALVLYCGGSLAAQTPEVTIPRIDRPPTLADFEQMRPTGASVRMAVVAPFVNRLPRDGEPMSEPTEVYLGYDSQALHVVFVCHDSDPAAIRATLDGRDRTGNDDTVALQIDTFRDRTHAFGFQVNPVGVQNDGVWTEGQGWDLSFDTVWTSEARITDGGYLVVMSVPFSSLRFPRADDQAWGLMLFRGIARRNEQGFWPAFSTAIAGRMNQAGVLRGLHAVSPGRNVQWVPYVSGRAYRALDTARPSPQFARDLADLAGGFDAKWVVRDSAALDVTANPDFSQVESDEPQVTVNRRFEAFFPERRPFFLEGASFFDTPIPLLFTRRIAQPVAGARLTGRVGRVSAGALVVADRPDRAAPSQVAVARLTRDVGSQSAVGVFASRRDERDSSNRVMGVDARARVGAHWFVTGQSARSETVARTGGDLAGTAQRVTLRRDGRAFTYAADYQERSLAFDARLGYIDRVNIRSVEQAATYRWRPSGRALLSWGPDVVATEVRDRTNHPLDRRVVPRMSFEWPGQTFASAFVQRGSLSLRPREAAVLTPMRFSDNRAGLSVSTAFRPALALNAAASTGDGVNVDPANGAVPTLGRRSDLSVGGSVRATGHLTVSVSALAVALRASDEARTFETLIGRIKLLYQFNTAWSVRTILQWDRLSANADRTSLASRRGLNGDLLVTYLPSPGTAVYIGVNDNLSDIDPRLILGPRGLRRAGGRLRSDGRQVFVKASYLFRR